MNKKFALDYLKALESMDINLLRDLYALTVSLRAIYSVENIEYIQVGIKV